MAHIRSSFLSSAPKEPLVKKDLSSLALRTGRSERKSLYHGATLPCLSTMWTTCELNGMNGKLQPPIGTEVKILIYKIITIKLKYMRVFNLKIFIFSSLKKRKYLPICQRQI